MNLVVPCGYHDRDKYHLLKQARLQLEAVGVEKKFDLTMGRNAVGKEPGR